MKTTKFFATLSIFTFIVAIAVLGYLIKTSQALSYLSTNPRACINCHAMNSQYATWQHSSHRNVATCVDCHLPTDNTVDKYIAKAKDGWNHSVAFTLNSYEQNIQISEDGARRIQKNCRSCHATLVENVVVNEQRYHDFKNTEVAERKCWECHRDVPHGRVRSLSSTPDNLGVREL
jgi:cytochrome c nitrite reductase small subunit